MTRRSCLALLLALAGCTFPVNAPVPQRSASAPIAAGAEDDGTYLRRIDPLGGQWRVERLGQQDFTRFNGLVALPTLLLIDIGLAISATAQRNVCMSC